MILSDYFLSAPSVQWQLGKQLGVDHAVVRLPEDPEFDISNPADVQEIAKLHLSKYYHSEALYNHRAVMIGVNANIFGFEMEGQENGNYKKDYLVFSYEDDKFVQKLKVETKNKYGEIHSSRGTFIGEVFYLLTRDGSVRSFDLNTGEELERL